MQGLRHSSPAGVDFGENSEVSVLPDAIDHHASGKGIVGIGNPPGKAKPALSLGCFIGEAELG